MGYYGKIQYLFSVLDNRFYSSTLLNKVNACNNNENVLKCSGRPLIYNATVISNWSALAIFDNQTNAAFLQKQLFGMDLYNSVFINFKPVTYNSYNTKIIQLSSTVTTDPYFFVSTPSLRKMLNFRNNTFVHCGNNSSVQLYHSNRTPMNGFIETSQPVLPSNVSTTGNILADHIEGIDWKISFSPEFTKITEPAHPIPDSILSSSLFAPNDGFFSPVNYRGAFDATKKTIWTDDWTYVPVITQKEFNPTDFNHDGRTDIIDFNILMSRFGMPDL